MLNGKDACTCDIHSKRSIALLYLTGTEIPPGRTHEAGTEELSFACAEGANDQESSIPTGASKQLGTQSSEGNSKSQGGFEWLSRTFWSPSEMVSDCILDKKILNFEDL